MKSFAWTVPRLFLPYRLWAPGVLELKDRRLSFTLTGPTPRRPKWEWAEERSGEPNLVERVKNGEAVTLFDEPASEIAIEFSRTGPGVKLTVHGETWRTTFMDPIKQVDQNLRAARYGEFGQAAAGIRQIPDLRAGRALAKEWREALGR